MGAFISKQPNGLYCRFSTVVDCPTHWNMTEEDYLDNCTGTVMERECGEDILNNYLQPFSKVIESFASTNMTLKEFNQLLKLMS